MQLYPSTDLKMGSGGIGAGAIGPATTSLFSMLGRLFYPAFMLQLRLHFSLDGPTVPLTHSHG